MKTPKEAELPSASDQAEPGREGMKALNPPEADLRL
jgi:hypothetical protein